jgi:hypothetical protein
MKQRGRRATSVDNGDDEEEEELSVVGIYLPSGASAREGLEEGVVVRAVDSFGVFGRRPVLEVLSGGGRGFLLG